MSTTLKSKHGSYVRLTGKAYGPNIMQECCICHNIFVMSCEDYLFNNCGLKVFDNDPDKVYDKPGWCCEECSEEILRIKNM